MHRKKNEIMAFPGKQMQLDIIILSKISQIENIAFFSFVDTSFYIDPWNIHTYTHEHVHIYVHV